MQKDNKKTDAQWQIEQLNKVLHETLDKKEIKGVVLGALSTEDNAGKLIFSINGTHDFAVTALSDALVNFAKAKEVGEVVREAIIKAAARIMAVKLMADLGLGDIENDNACENPNCPVHGKK